jgi:hypothetical protein
MWFSNFDPRFQLNEKRSIYFKCHTPYAMLSSICCFISLCSPLLVVALWRVGRMPVAAPSR